MDEIPKERAFENDAFQEDSSATLAENIFRSRAPERRVLYGEMALRARESGASGIGKAMGRLALSRRNFSVGVSIRELRVGGHRRRYGYFAALV